MARLSSLRHQLFAIRPRSNTYLRSGWIVRLPGNHAALPKKSGFGFAFIFPAISPVGSVLFTADSQHQLLRQARVPQSTATAVGFSGACR